MTAHPYNCKAMKFVYLMISGSITILMFIHLGILKSYINITKKINLNGIFVSNMCDTQIYACQFWLNSII